MKGKKRHSDQNIYDPVFVNHLFENMSGTYARMNIITSFGFCLRWRKQCVNAVPISPNMHVVDLMTGMGEAWPYIFSQTKNKVKITGIDFCKGMVRFAEKQKNELGRPGIDILCENVLHNSLPQESVDVIISTFGLKTFSEDQTKKLAKEIKRLLKPGGSFSLLEISVPKISFLRWPYLFYLKYIIPVLGKLFLGDPDNYRMLGIYTEQFGDCSKVETIFAETGFEVKMKKYFLGCATGLVGKKI